MVCRKFRHTTQHGAIEGKTQNKEVKLYNLDVIISVGYRVKSLRGTQFRIWAMKILKEYMQKGFALDDQRLKELGGGNYFDVILGQTEDIPIKPSPEGVFKIMKLLSVDKTQVIYLGDTGTDMNTGKGADLFTIGALWGFRDAKELKENQADAGNGCLHRPQYGGGPSCRRTSICNGSSGKQH